MADKMSPAKRSELMSKVKSKGNRTTEMRMVSAFRKVGVKGWVRHLKIGSCRPDFTFRKQRVVVFLDRCFWHSCPFHGSSPESNFDFWSKKLKANAERDTRFNAELSSAGWKVVRLWEHAIRKDADGCAYFLVDILDFVGKLDQI